MQTQTQENETTGHAQSGLAVKDYHRRFVKAARDELDPRTFAKLHHFAKSSAGGAAPRRPSPPPPAQPGDWDDGETKEPIQKSWVTALTNMWSATVQAITGANFIAKDAGACGSTGSGGAPVAGVGGAQGAPHIAAPLGVSGPRKKKRGKRFPPTEQEVIKKYADLGKAIAAADQVEPAGFAVQLDAGGKRVPGFMAVGADGHDNWTLEDDLALGVPLERACADIVYVSKAAVDAHGQMVLEEARRIAKPDANVILEDGIKIQKGAACDKEAPRKSARGKSRTDKVFEIIDKVEKSKPGHEELPLEERLERCTEERREMVLKAISKPFPIAGVNKHEQIMYGPVLVPGERHFSGDYMTPADIRHTAHGYMENGRLIGGEHSSEIDACIIESFIAPMDLAFKDGPYGPQTIPAGSWVAAVKVRDPDQWEKVLSGEYTGFSTGGWGSRGPWEDAA